MKEGLILLDEKIIKKQGAFERVIRYWKEWHPELENAVLTNGITGRETKQEIDIIKPARTFMVYERKADK